MPFLKLLFPFLLVFVPQEAGTLEAPTQIEQRRERVLEIARSYVHHEWRGTSKNALHGEDPAGVAVDTPDESFHPEGWSLEGELNRGVPYQWGGFSTLEDFDRGIAAGLLAGHIPDRGSNPGTRNAVGVDCSGLISRCWELPLKQSTRSLGWLCIELEDWFELQPGDLINGFDGHAVIFDEFVDAEHVRVYEAATPKVREYVYPLAQLVEAGMKPLRYKPLDHSWVPVEQGPPESTLHMGTDPLWITAEVDREAPAPPLLQAKVGQWARYREVGAGQDGLSFVHQVSRVSAGEVELQVSVEAGGYSMQTSEMRDSALDALHLVPGFAPHGQRIDSPRFEILSRETGHLEACAQLDSWRTSARIEGSFLTRGEHYPVALEVDLIHSEEVPVEGVIRIEINAVFELAGGKRERRTVYELVEYGAQG